MIGGSCSCTTENFSAAQECCPPEQRNFSAMRKHYLPEKPFATRCRFGSAETLPSHFVHRMKSVATKRSLLKQADLKRLRVAVVRSGKIFPSTLNAQLSTHIAGFSLLWICSHPPRVGGQSCCSLLAIRHSPFTIRCLSDLPICRPHDLPIIPARQEPCPPIFPCPVSLVPCPVLIQRSISWSSTWDF